MQIVFMNRLVKESGSDESRAEVWIGEAEGAWKLGWRDMHDSGEVQESIWYEGGSWNEMLYIYRHELAVKLGQGFRPLIDGILLDGEDQKGRSQSIQKLYCYSELNYQELLYNELCAWRRKKAAAERKAPYFIATNRLLRLISTFVPMTVEELLQLPGVGENKAAEYGADVLNITSGQERSHSFPLDWVHDMLDEHTYESWVYKQKELKYKQDLDKYRTKQMLLRGISEGKRLEHMEQESSLTRRELVESLEQLEKEGYDVDTLIAGELQEMPQSEQSEVWNAFEELGDALLKPILQRVYGQEAAAGSVMELRYERLRLIRMRFRREGESRRNAG
ncbi:HRDC domain-containing protein [Paenibacillus dokdonensis]|uniref:HRDC domain-containing protein n=1 Tax=Paenibacillus dokdonensis TaxID=2567944 RepID=A0ABU6GH13_9BACL|nr:HRDC domain-containing protein [Paenibacillus dokdonensis]MEC0238664.1 HRDC domain-containing protein [Paenibacillus dokdonensis]